MRPPPSSHAHTASLLWALPCGPLAWERTPPAVQDSMKRQPPPLAQLQSQMGQCQSPLAPLPHQGETLHGRVAQTSPTARPPPASAAPGNQPTRRRHTASGTRGGHQRPRGHGPPGLRPTAVPRIAPAPWPWGQGHGVALTPSSTQPGSALPPIALAVHHCILHQGRGPRGASSTPAVTRCAPAPAAGAPDTKAAHASRPPACPTLRPGRLGPPRPRGAPWLPRPGTAHTPGRGAGAGPPPRGLPIAVSPTVPQRPVWPGATMGQASGAARAPASRTPGATNAHPVAPLSAVGPAAGHHDATPSARPAATPPARHCSAWAPWPTPRPRGGRGRPGRPALGAAALGGVLRAPGVAPTHALAARG
jgi:hypothetical protein